MKSEIKFKRSALSDLNELIHKLFYSRESIFGRGKSKSPTLSIPRAHPGNESKPWILLVMNPKSTSQSPVSRTANSMDQTHKANENHRVVHYRFY